MPGMSHPLQVDNPLVVSAFYRTLGHDLLLLLAVGVALALAWNVAFTLQQRADRLATATSGAGAATGATAGADGGGTAVPTAGAEPLGRRVARISFGLLWLLDGALQAQRGMPLGMPGSVVQPGASGSPGWVHALVNVGTTIWSDHPVEAAAAAVWVQVGIGLALLVAPRGWWSRAAGAVSLGWALVVWAFGEAFGGIFAPGLSWAFGAPGAVVFYAAAGGLLALPERAWYGRRLGRLVTGALGAFFCGMAVLQAWPGRGSWHGAPRGAGTDLGAMVRAMAQTPQPHVLASWLSSFAGFDGAHAWGVNLFLVVALGAVGSAVLSGRRSLVLAAAAAAAVLCLANWVLVQDLGFFGGVGTDPNSMVPTLALLAAGVVALVRYPAEAVVPEPALLPRAAWRSGREWWRVATPGVLARTAAVLAAFAVVLAGAVPMAAASTNPAADPIVAEAVNGTPNLVDRPAPPFDLTDQSGRAVSLASLRGKVVVLTFLDPVCTSTCPLIAQSMRQADSMLGAQASHAELVAVVVNPIYRSVATVDAFDRQEGMGHLANWLYLTGSLRELTRVWNAYGVQVTISPAGAMVAHSDIAYIIDRQGRMREVLSANPGTTSSSHASLSTLIADQLRAVMGA
jgi:cytochrome oxidase Cu insertion factor (SCO1/SenC/PrrC family)